MFVFMQKQFIELIEKKDKITLYILEKSVGYFFFTSSAQCYPIILFVYIIYLNLWNLLAFFVRELFFKLPTNLPSINHRPIILYRNAAATGRFSYHSNYYIRYLYFILLYNHVTISTWSIRFLSYACYE